MATTRTRNFMQEIYDTIPEEDKTWLHLMLGTHIELKEKLTAPQMNVVNMLMRAVMQNDSTSHSTGSV